VSSLLLALALSALPASATARYRWEIGGEPVGTALLAVRCGGTSCAVRWSTAARLPEAAGGGVQERSLELGTDREGRLRAVRGGGAADRTFAGDGVPQSLAEVLLSAAREGERRCLTVVEEESGQSGTACAVRRGPWLEGEVRGTWVRFRARPGGLPEEVQLPDQGTRFVADPGAAVPDRAPRLFGVAVPADQGTVTQAWRFCGFPPEPEAGRPPAGVPAEFEPGPSCREMTALYLDAVRRSGLGGRHVVGVAFDGAGFVWHEWAEVRAENRWVPVDPAFGQLPAEGPRFAVARFAPGDAAARADAGRRVLACWGRARVRRGQ
jgi:hypothetical protein